MGNKKTYVVDFRFHIKLCNNAGMKENSLPTITNENIPEVYEYYRDNPVNKNFANFAHHLFSAVFRTDVSLWSKDAEEYIDDSLAQESRLILTANHRTEYDQYVIASLPIRVNSFKPIIGATFIPTKTELFRDDTKKYKARRWAIDQLGAVPTYRAKDFEAEDDCNRKIATDLLLDVSIERINNGQHMAIFPEGTRNKEKPLEVQKIHRGIGEIVCRSAVADKVVILPIGIVYGDKVPNEDRRPRRVAKLEKGVTNVVNALSPTVHIGEPLVGPFDRPETVRSALLPALQKSVDTAVFVRNVFK